MATSCGILRPFAVRAVRAIIVIAIRLATASTVHADTPGPERFAEDLREAHFARVGIAGRTYVLVRPRVAHDGLAYQHLEGGRPAIIIDSSTLKGAPPNPVPWSSIERLEAGHRTRQPGMLTGLTIGLLGGVLMGAYMGAFTEMEDEGSGPRVAVSITAIGALAGLGIGALFPTTKWVDVSAPVTP